MSNEFWTAVAVAFFASLPATLVSIGTLIGIIADRRATKELHHQIQGRMTELIDSSKGQSRAEGQIDGAATERDRQHVERSPDDRRRDA
jgi:hypothetical protein